MKRCPPGVLCVENVTIVFIFIIIFVIGVFLYSSHKDNEKKIIINDNITAHFNSNSSNHNNSQPNGNSNSWLSFLPSYPYNNLAGPQDVLLNPYSAPYKDERYLVSELAYVPRNAVPINISTNVGATPANTSYRQMGIITPLNGASKDNILPLMGRPLFTNRNKWQYYTISNQHNNVKLPISFKGRSALNDYGVDQIFSSDTVYVEGYNEPFKVTMYETDTIKYLPFI
jgi:hypothetical protein